MKRVQKSPRSPRGKISEDESFSDDSNSEYSINDDVDNSNFSRRSMNTSGRSAYDGSPISSPRNINASHRSTRSSSSRSFTSSPGNSPSGGGRRMYPPLISDSDNSFTRQGIYPKLDEHLDSSRNCSRSEITSETTKPRSRSNYSKGSDARRVANETKSPASSNSGRDSERGKADTSLSPGVIFVLIFGFVFVCAIFYFNNPFTSSGKEKTLSPYEVFTTEIKRLQQSFPLQESRLWRTVIASSMHVLNEPNSTYPSVIILASQAKASHLSFCIAEKMASSFEQSQGIVSSSVSSKDVNSLKHLGASEQKLALDKDIQKIFGTSDGKAYVIRNLQALDPMASILFHGLCDGDNAPFKDVMYLLTLEVNGDLPTLTARGVEDYLIRLWTTPQMGYDKVSAVMSRIANNVVIVQAEDPNTVRQYCV